MFNNMIWDVIWFQTTNSRLHSKIPLSNTSELIFATWSHLEQGTFVTGHTTFAETMTSLSVRACLIMSYYKACSETNSPSAGHLWRNACLFLGRSVQQVSL